MALWETILIFLLLFLFVGIAVFYVYLDDKRRNERMVKVRTHRIIIFSTMTKEEFETNKDLFDFEQVGEEEFSLLKKNKKKERAD